MANESLPHLLRAIASGSNARESKHDVIFNAAADELEQLRELLNDDDYIRWRADHARGHLSWGNMISEREAKAGFVRASK